LNNPNILYGHEGKLLQIVNNSEIIQRNSTPAIFVKCGDIVMFLEASPLETQSENLYIRIIHNEQIVDLAIPPSNWMYYFIPWPHGGFISSSSSSSSSSGGDDDDVVDE